ncbi:hypothetical protein F2P81_023622 [Scophthalmus maximus]|uniref:Uncharacterized protein n=1 Tax=Scophthalmus maximus TaxID=52904 RepID=A0A6A4RZM2_SCOMX|nr:hypothetical protein F2P81_023622 [Scophthalmus maximus]
MFLREVGNHHIKECLIHDFSSRMSSDQVISHCRRPDSKLFFAVLVQDLEQPSFYVSRIFRKSELTESNAVWLEVKPLAKVEMTSVCRKALDCRMRTVFRDPRQLCEMALGVEEESHLQYNRDHLQYFGIDLVHDAPRLFTGVFSSPMRITMTVGVLELCFQCSTYLTQSCSLLYLHWAASEITARLHSNEFQVCLCDSRYQQKIPGLLRALSLLAEI